MCVCVYIYIYFLISKFQYNIYNTIIGNENAYLIEVIMR